MWDRNYRNLDTKKVTKENRETLYQYVACVFLLTSGLSMVIANFDIEWFFAGYIGSWF